MTFSHVQFNPRTGTAKLIYRRNGGAVERPMPPGKEPPVDTVSAEWDADTLTLTCLLTDQSTASIVLTPAEIEAQATAPVDESPEPQSLTLEDWLAAQGYTATCLLLLSQYEAALASAALTVTEATETRAWINAITARYASGETRATDWETPPHKYETVVAACQAALAPSA